MGEEEVQLRMSRAYAVAVSPKRIGCVEMSATGLLLVDKRILGHGARFNR